MTHRLPESLRQRARDAWAAKDPTPEQRIVRAYGPPPWKDWWWVPDEEYYANPDKYNT